VGPLAKLRARIHALTHSSPKPASKPSKAAKPHDAATPAREQPQPVASVRISLPMSTGNHVAADDPRTLHGLYHGDDVAAPVSTADAHGPQAGGPTAASTTAEENGFVPREMIEKSAATEQVEQWPYGPQAAASVPKTANGTPAAANDFDPIPVEEYQAAVARAKDDGTAIPAFHQGPQPPSEGLHASNASPEPVPATAPIAAQPMPSPSAAAVMELGGEPTVDTPPSQTAPPLIPIGPAESAKSLQEPGGSSQRVGLQEPAPSPEQPQPAAPQTLAPVPQTAAAPALLPAEQKPAPTLVIRPGQRIGGRYGQPAWMTAPRAN
jgi:hypothetical protein